MTRRILLLLLLLCLGALLFSSQSACLGGFLGKRFFLENVALGALGSSRHVLQIFHGLRIISNSIHSLEIGCKLAHGGNGLLAFSKIVLTQLFIISQRALQAVVLKVQFGSDCLPAVFREDFGVHRIYCAHSQPVVSSNWCSSS